MATRKKKIRSLNIDSSSKSKTEKYTVKGLEGVVPQIRKIDNDMAKMQEHRKAMKNMIINKVMPIKEKEEKAGRLYKTFIIESDDGAPATVLYKNAFSKIPISNEEQMRKELGDYFNELYEITTQIAPRRGINWDKLRKVLDDKFDDFFGETRIIAHKKDFMERRAELRGEANKRVNDVLEQYTKDCQASPDLRVPKIEKPKG